MLGPPRNWALPLIVMLGLVPGIHVLRPCNSKDVDGRDIGVRKHGENYDATVCAVGTEIGHPRTLSDFTVHLHVEAGPINLPKA